MKDAVSEVFSHPKTPVSQAFIQSTLQLDIPDDYKRTYEARVGRRLIPLLKLEFNGLSVDAPLMSIVARRLMLILIF